MISLVRITNVRNDINFLMYMNLSPHIVYNITSTQIKPGSNDHEVVLKNDHISRTGVSRSSAI